MLASSLVSACSTTYLARPVGRGNTRVNGSAGGPIANLFNAPIPAPITTVGIAHGVTDSTDVHADFHPTAAAFDSGPGTVPILGLDMGFAYHPIPGHRAAATVGAAAYGFTNRADAVVFADFWLASSTRVTTWFSIAGGLHNVIRIASSDAELNRRPVWNPTLFAQIALRPFSGRFEFELEARWYAFTENGRRAVPAYFSIGEAGALGFQIGANWHFGGALP